MPSRVGVVMLCLALGACGRVAPGTTGIDRGPMPVANYNATPSATPSSGTGLPRSCRTSYQECRTSPVTGTTCITKFVDGPC